ncbi:MAG: hypothetical protein IIB60_04605, partial [Planctomycetes bacterium]|nr:hypothetical protein [Planctomycetota bacterium]
MKTDQFVWCFTEYTRDYDERKVEWALDVPTNEILRFVDEIVWARIRRERPALPARIRDEFWKQWIERRLHDPAPRDQDLRERTEEFWAQEPLSGDWWDELFLEPDEADKADIVSALI